MALEKEETFLDNLIVYEPCELNTLYALLASGTLLKNWDRSNFAIDTTKRYYESEVKQIEEYVHKYDHDVGAVPVLLKRARHGWGRVFGQKSLCMSNMYRATRHTIAEGMLYDIDIKNCQVEILRQVCKSNNISYPMVLDNYCTRREQIIQYHLKYCGLGSEWRWFIKTLFLRLIFCGSWDGFRLTAEKEHGLSIPRQITGFCYEFKAGMMTCARELIKLNPTLHKVAMNNKERKDSRTSVEASFLSLYLQDYEQRILAHALCTMHKSHGLFGKNGKFIGSYEYDGFKILKSEADGFNGGKEGVCMLASNITKEKYNLELVFEEKEMDEGFDLSWVTDAQIGDVRRRMEQDTNTDTSKGSKSKKQDIEQDPIASYITTLSDRDICELVEEETEGAFLYRMPAKQWMTWDGTRWKPDDVSLWKLIPSLVDRALANKFVQEQWTEIATKCRRTLVRDLGNFRKVSPIIKMAEKVYADYDTQFDMETDILGFNNGVFDFNQWQFRPAEKEDYVTMTVGWEYIPDQDDSVHIEEIREIFELIHPVKEHREFFLYILASGLSGRAIEHFFVLNGRGRNGKGLINQAMCILLGGYAENASVSILTESSKSKTSAAGNPEKAKLNKKRYVIMKEPDRNTPLQNNTIKDMTGGGSIQGRFLFSNETEILLHMTLVMETNARPPVAEEAQGADFDRWIDYLFASHFTADSKKWNPDKFVYPINPQLKKREWWIERRNGLMKMLLEYLEVLHKRNYVLSDIVPESIKKRTLEYLQGSFALHRVFLACYHERDDTKKYVDDTDPSLQTVANNMMSSSAFTDIPWKERNKYTLNCIKNYFQDSDFFQELLYKRGNSIKLRGYRLTEVDERNESADGETDELSEDSDFEMDPTEEELNHYHGMGDYL